MDPHKNVFYYYRGQIKGEKARENQIEDNTTKALVNLLENGGPTIQQEFLKSIRVNGSKEILKFTLQASQEGSRPDAVIDLSKKKILIESKVQTELIKRQLINHLKFETEKDLILLVITNRKSDEKTIEGIGDERIKFTTWEDIYEVFEKIKTKKGSKDEFVLKEFLKYLELINMKPFTGFTKEDFDYFYDMDDYYGKVIKNKVAQLAKEISKELKGTEVIRNYPLIKEGNLDKKKHLDNRDRNIWVMFCNPDDLSAFRTSNFCITLDSEKIRLNLVLSGQRYTAKKYPIGRFYNYLDDEKRTLKLFRKLKGMALYVSERTDGRGHHPRRGADRWRSKAVIENDLLNSKEGIEFLKHSLRDVTFPGINISVTYPKSEVVGKNKKGLVGDMAKKLPILYKVLKDIKEHNFFETNNHPSK